MFLIVLYYLYFVSAELTMQNECKKSFDMNISGMPNSLHFSKTKN